MSISEDQLRTELHDALSTVGPDLPHVDAAALVDSGHRVVRRRRLAAIGGVAAFAAAVAVGTSVLGGADRAGDVRPGVSTPARGTSSATIELPGPEVAGGIEATRFVVKIGPNAMPHVDGAPPSGADLAYYAVVDGQEQLMAGSSTTPGQATFGYGDGTDVVIGIVPVDAVEASLQADGVISGHAASDLAQVPGTQFKAIAFRLDAVPTTQPDIEPIWWRADGTPVTNDGSGSVVRFQTDKGGYDLWAIPGLDLYGHRGPGGGGTSSLSALFNEGVADLDATADYVEDLTKTPMTVRSTPVHLYVIRGRASDVRGTYNDKVVDAAATEVKYFPALDATVVLARADQPEMPGTPGEYLALLTRLTWTDAKGAKQSHDFR